VFGYSLYENDRDFLERKRLSRTVQSTKTYWRICGKELLDYEREVLSACVKMAVSSQLMVLARKAAAVQALDPALVCAVVEQESAWNPCAIRYEPLFFAKYVASLYTNNKVSATEAYARGFSWGLMQVMGQVARETGFDALFLSALCDPEQGLAIGCKVLRKKFDAMAGDTARALLAWNGGSNPAYPAQVLARKAHYL
jgi:soluble lytic murein transglycosylase-like protein